MEIYDVAIIGCGKVAGMYGEEGDTSLQTHASAYNLHKKTKIIAAVDPDKNQLEKFSDKWQIQNRFLSIEKMFETVYPQIISICSPTANHYKDFKYAASFPLLGVFMEKPLSNDLDESKELAQMNTDFPVAVNYFRRWNKELQILKEQLKNFEYGEIRKITGYYTKGLINNGSHVLDLLMWYFRDVRFNSLIRRYPKKNQDFGVDCTLLVNNQIPVYLLHIQDVDYVYIEIEIICEFGLIKISQRGQKIEIYKKEQDPDYKVFNRMQLSESIETRWNKCFFNAIENLILSIEKGDKVLCTKEDGYKVSLLCHEILSENDC